jgi:glucose/arabinose dehydrogenase
MPGDNPFVPHPYAKPEIYSFGHRNVQGLAIHPKTGALWASEHGPYGDEVNVILPGGNYGWPLATVGREYDGTVISKSRCAPNTTSPFVFWVPSIGISGMTFYSGKRFLSGRGISSSVHWPTGRFSA